MNIVRLLIIFGIIFLSTPPVLAAGPGDVFDVLGTGGYGPGIEQATASQLTRMPTGIGNGPNGGDIYLAYNDKYGYTYEFTDDGQVSLIQRQDLSAYFGAAGATSATRAKGQWSYTGRSDIYALLAAGADAFYVPTLATFHVSSGGGINPTAIDVELNSPFTISQHRYWSLEVIGESNDLIGTFNCRRYGDDQGVVSTWYINTIGQITILYQYYFPDRINITSFGYLWDNAEGDLIYGLGTDAQATGDTMYTLKITDDSLRTVSLLDGFGTGTDSFPTFRRLGNSYDVIVATGANVSTLGVMDCTQSGSVNGYAGTTVEFADSISNNAQIRNVRSDTYTLTFYGPEPPTVADDGTYVYEFICPIGTTDMDASNLLNWELLDVTGDWLISNPKVVQLNDLDINFMIISSGTYVGVNNVNMSFAVISTETIVGTPTVTTQQPTGMGSTSFTANGTITDTGGDNPTYRGFCWNTTGNPTTSDYGDFETGSFGVGSYSIVLTGIPLTSIYLRAFATNSEGTSYGNQIEVSLGAPLVYTIGVSETGTNSVNMIGYISSAGGSTLQERGFYYNTTGSPTASDNTVATIFGLSTGSFFEKATGLNSNTLYYYRAFATNSYGTDIGNELSFVTTPAYNDNTLYLNFQPWNIFPPSSPGTISDISPYDNDASYILADMIDGVTVYVTNELAGGVGFYPPQGDSDLPNKWVVPPQSGMTQQGDSSHLPLYEIFEEVGDDIGMDPGLLYIMMMFGVSMGIGFLVYLIVGSLLMSLLVMIVLMTGFMSTGILPLWVLIFFVAFALGLMYVSRQT